jgi:outer membrane protein assembly factor BamB
MNVKLATSRWSGCAVWGLTSALVLVGVRGAEAQEWTRFRGPNGSGVSNATTVPVQIGASDINWTASLPGKGHSCPVVWGNKLFLLSADPESLTRFVVCVDTRNGKELWRQSYPFTKHNKHKFNTFASATPTVDRDGVYVVWSNPEAFLVLAFDHKGKELWKRDLGAFVTQHSGAASPILFGDVLIVGREQEEGEGILLGLNRKTGANVWQKTRPAKNAIYATPLIYRPKSGPAEVIFTSTLHGITSLNPLTGELNWEASDVFKYRCVASPILAGDVVFATAGQGGGGTTAQAVGVRPGSRQGNVPPKVEYQPARGFSYVPTPIAVGEYIFFWNDAGIVTCIKAATGEELWKERVGGDFFASPIAVNGKLYGINAHGELVVLEAGPKFKVLARYAFEGGGDAFHATPGVANGVLYVRSESHLFSVGGKKQ